MPTFDSILARYNALKEEHPIVNFGDIKTSINSKKKLQFDLRVIVPMGYHYSKPINHVFMNGCFELVSGTYTLVGLARKITELENLNWEFYEDFGKKAFKELRRLKKKHALP